MFNLFKKKEPKPAPQSVQRTPRDLLLGDLTPNEWLGNGSTEIPWSLFAEAYDQFMVRGDLKSAVKTYKKILETGGLERVTIYKPGIFCASWAQIHRPISPVKYTAWSWTW